METRKWDERQWVLERETLYLAMEYVIFFLGKATAAKPLFELLLETNPESSSRTLSTISNMETNARHQLNSRINMIFPIGQRTTVKELLGIRHAVGLFHHTFILGDKSVSEWQDESVQMVTTAMCQYVSVVRLFLKSLLFGILTRSLSPKTSRHVSASSHKIKDHPEWPLFLLCSQ